MENRINGIVEKQPAFLSLVGVAGMLLGADMRAQNPSNAAGSSADALPKDVYPESQEPSALAKAR